MRLILNLTFTFFRGFVLYSAAFVYSVFRMTGGKVALSIKKWEQHIQMPGKGPLSQIIQHNFTYKSINLQKALAHYVG